MNDTAEKTYIQCHECDNWSGISKEGAGPCRVFGYNTIGTEECRRPEATKDRGEKK